jgi:pimeloyl-ACP methyl ester carboxylesterase
LGRARRLVVAALHPKRAASLVAGKARHRAPLVARVVAKLAFDDATFDRAAGAFDNPDFIAVVIHSYRHRYGLVAGDPAYAPIEAMLAPQPQIVVPAITIDGDADGVNPGTAHHAKKFTGPYEHRVFRGAGHNLPQERPEEWARAVIDARTMTHGCGAEEVASR